MVAFARAATMAVLTGLVGFGVGQLLLLLRQSAGPWFYALAAVLGVGVAEIARIWRAGRDVSPGLFIAGQLVVLFALVRLSTGLIVGFGTLAGEAAGWLGAPLRMLDFSTLTGLAVATLAWRSAGDVTRDLEESAGTPDDQTMADLNRRFVRGGIVLALSSGLAVVGFDALADFTRPPVTEIVVPMLAYLVIGLLMLGQVRSAVLRAGWVGRGDEVDPSMAGRWWRVNLAFLAVVLLVAFLLPTSSSAAIIQVLRGIGAVLGAVVSFLGALLFPEPTSEQQDVNLSRLGTPPAGGGEGGPTVTTAPPPVEAEEPSAFLEFVAAAWPVFFWVVMGILAVLVVVGLTVGAPGEPGRLGRLLRRIVAALGSLPAVGRLVTWLKSLWRRLFDEEREDHLELRPRGRLRGRGLLPRLLRGSAPVAGPGGQVRRAYLSMVRLAGRRGILRSPAQTPHEFSPDVAHRVTDVGPDVEALTDLFAEARYSSHSLDAGHARRAQTHWSRIRGALKRVPRDG